jgi:hypothetical protein
VTRKETGESASNCAKRRNNSDAIRGMTPFSREDDWPPWWCR